MTSQTTVPDTFFPTQYHLGRDGDAVDLFKMVGGRVTDYTKEHPGVFRDLLTTCYAEEADVYGPWLARILKNQGKNLHTYGHDLLTSEPQYLLCHTAMCLLTGA